MRTIEKIMAHYTRPFQNGTTTGFFCTCGVTEVVQGDILDVLMAIDRHEHEVTG